MSQPIDYSTQYGAQILADRIKAYWSDRGVTVKCSVVPVTKRIQTRLDACYGISSDIGMYEPRSAL